MTSPWLNKIKPELQVPAGQKISARSIVTVVTSAKDSRQSDKIQEIKTIIKRLMPNAEIALASGKRIRFAKGLAGPTAANFRILIGHWKATATN